MNDSDMPIFGKVMMIIAFIAIGISFYEMSMTPSRVNKVDQLLVDTSGLSLTRITVNSPTIYVEVQSSQEFLELLKQNNCTQSYRENTSLPHYYIFSEDSTIGYRIHYSTIWEEIK